MFFFFRWAVLGLAFFVKKKLPLDPKSPWKNVEKMKEFYTPPKMCVFFNNEGGEFPWLVVV